MRDVVRVRIFPPPQGNEARERAFHLAVLCVAALMLPFEERKTERRFAQTAAACQRESLMRNNLDAIYTGARASRRALDLDFDGGDFGKMFGLYVISVCTSSSSFS